MISYSIFAYYVRFWLPFYLMSECERPRARAQHSTKAFSLNFGSRHYSSSTLNIYKNLWKFSDEFQSTQSCGNSHSARFNNPIILTTIFIAFNQKPFADHTKKSSTKYTNYQKSFHKLPNKKKAPIKIHQISFILAQSYYTIKIC